MASKLVQLHAAAVATATGETIPAETRSVVMFELSGTFAATVTFEGTVEGSTWIAIRAMRMSNGNMATTGANADLYRAVVTGLKTVRARISAYTSGSLTVWARSTDAPGGTP